ncbi:MAG: methylaspartate ammonia-lyase [Planctomycetota bacterium]|nr:methylaspartate ammonia-lyase [Planctomycetota bacterium]
MKIEKVQIIPITGGWYCDDKAVFIAGKAQTDHYLVRGRPQTPGFKDVREVGRGLCVILHLENSQAVFGDGTSVTYAGSAGRDPIFRFEEHVTAFEELVEPYLIGRDVADFIDLADQVESLRRNGRKLHPAIRYAVSQALLEAAAVAQPCTKAEILADAYGVKISDLLIRVGIQSGQDRYAAVDKAIYRRVDVFPHGLIKNVADDFGTEGERLLDYARWIIARLDEHKIEEDYRPVIHFDCYGTIGRAFNHDVGRMTDYLRRLAGVVSPLSLQIESPVEMDSRQAQIDTLVSLREALGGPDSGIVLIADEWCNSLEDVSVFAQAGAVDMIQIKMPDLGSITLSAEAILECKKHGLGAYLGGSCNETDLSARNAVHLAVALGADQILARPGMGVDEAVSIVRNEEARLRAVISVGT